MSGAGIAAAAAGAAISAGVANGGKSKGNVPGSNDKPLSAIRAIRGR
jgi:hypothetical protein